MTQNNTQKTDSDSLGAGRLEALLQRLEAMDMVDDIAMYKRLENAIRKKHNRKRRITFLRATAAVLLPLLMIAGGMWLYVGQNSKDTNGEIVKYAGTPKLIMPNGEEVIFDGSMDDGHIIYEPDVTIRQQDGSLIFHEKDMVSDRNEPHYYCIDVPKGAKLDIVLTDGTHVWLNADSRLRYPSFFCGGERRVYLEGEAYFEVSADPRKTFIVETKGQELKVLGTKFNIAAYGNESVIYTTLIEGKVSLVSAETKKETILAPGYQVQLHINSDMFTRREVNAEDMTAWRNDLIVFEGNTFEQMMNKLARIYDVEFIFEDDAIKNLLTYGTMPVQDDIAVILRLIEASGNVKFKIMGTQIRITTGQ